MTTPKPPNSRDIAAARTRERILAAALICFDRDGYEATTIRGIAKEADLSTGSIFNCWAGKAQLYTNIYGHPPVDPDKGRKLLLAAAVYCTNPTHQAGAEMRDAIEACWPEWREDL